jgi:hypothetical protein
VSPLTETLEKGSEGGIYVSDNATEEQRGVLEILAVKYIGGGFMMQRVLGIQDVKIDIEEAAGTVCFKMPYGEMEMHLTRSYDGNPVRYENRSLPFLPNVKAAHAPFWHWMDYMATRTATVPGQAFRWARQAGRIPKERG